MSETVVRAFEARDRAELLELFSRAGQGSPAASLWGHQASDAAIYLVPYMDREPESLFVAMVDGAMVGYLTGCIDGSTMPSGERADRAGDQEIPAVPSARTGAVLCSRRRGPRDRGGAARADRRRLRRSPLAVPPPHQRRPRRPRDGWPRP